MASPSHFIAFVDRHTSFLDGHQRSLAILRGKEDRYRSPTQAWVTTQLLGLLQQYPGGVTEAAARTHLCVRLAEQARATNRRRAPTCSKNLLHRDWLPYMQSVPTNKHPVACSPSSALCSSPMQTPNTLRYLRHATYTYVPHCPRVHCKR